MANNHEAFAQRYGRWAIVAGASEGTGFAAAEKLAARGLNLVLIARGAAQLEESAAQIRGRHDVEVRILPLDLTADDVAERVLAATDGLEVGLLFYNSGAAHNSDRFVDQPIEHPLRMIQINCIAPVRLAHALLPAMRTRKRGGIVTIGSMGCFVGTPHTAIYSAAKAFQVNFVEGLWAELKDEGIDIFSGIIGSTYTPGRERTLGIAFDPARDMTAEDVASEILDNLRNGPTRVVAKTDWGIGPMAKPWSEFRHKALTTMIDAVKNFKKRETAPTA